MTTTGTYSLSFENVDIVEEAFERIKIDPATLTTRHLRSALRSMALLLIDWQNQGIQEYKIEQFTLSAADFTNSGTKITLNSRVIRIFTAFQRDPTGGTNFDTPINQVGRDDYELLHDKTQTGDRPDRFFLDRQRAAPDMYVWPAVDTTTTRQILVDCFVRAQDIGDLSNNPDIPLLWTEAMCAGLAFKLLMKYGANLTPEDRADVKGEAIRTFAMARAEHRDTAPTTIRPILSRRRR